jgi:hypothetical protein
VALVDWNSLPLACTVAPANIHDSQLYEPTVEAFTIPEMQVHPSIISADAAYDAQKIRQYNRKPISRPTRDPGYTRSGEERAGSIRYCIKKGELLNGSSAGSRRSRRLFLDMNAMSTHSSGWSTWHVPP